MSNYNNYSDPMMEMLAEARKIVAETKATTTAPVEIKSIPTPKSIPATTYEACQKYGATPYRCGCPDRQKRDGGSYTGLDGRKACKHMVFHQKYYTDIAI